MQRIINKTEDFLHYVVSQIEEGLTENNSHKIFFNLQTAQQNKLFNKYGCDSFEEFASKFVSDKFSEEYFSLLKTMQRIMCQEEDFVHYVVSQIAEGLIENNRLKMFFGLQTVQQNELFNKYGCDSFEEFAHKMVSKKHSDEYLSLMEELNSEDESIYFVNK